ncbi:MAG: substrate-binding domain-containing protein [Galbitalea sp.]
MGTIALVTAIALSSCSSTPAPKPTATKSAAPTVDLSTLSGTITAGGSSAQANAEAAWTAAFTSVATGVTINYDKSQGSGGGVTNWLGGSYDFAGTDSALNPAQITTAATSFGATGGIDLPVYLSGVAIIFNLPGVTKLNLDSATIANIFNKKITTWNDPAIHADNPGVTLRPTRSPRSSARTASGTTANFTTYLSETQPTLWTYPVSTAWPVAGESAQQGGSGVVATVAAGKGHHRLRGPELGRNRNAGVDPARHRQDLRQVHGRRRHRRVQGCREARRRTATRVTSRSTSTTRRSRQRVLTRFRCSPTRSSPLRSRTRPRPS